MHKFVQFFQVVSCLFSLLKNAIIYDVHVHGAVCMLNKHQYHTHPPKCMSLACAENYEALNIKEGTLEILSQTLALTTISATSCHLCAANGYAALFKIIDEKAISLSHIL